MKLTQKHNNKAIKSGMTLLELTVVILVLLSLIAILFVGARAWKKGSDKAACIMNIRNVQQAVRGHMNMNPSLTTAPDSADIFTTTANPDGYLPAPSCVASGGGYTFLQAGETFGPGVLYSVCNLADSDGHEPSEYATW